MDEGANGCKREEVASPSPDGALKAPTPGGEGCDPFYRAQRQPMTSCRTSRRALVVGGSMSGLFAPLYLRGGWQADIFERSPVALTGAAPAS